MRTLWLAAHDAIFAMWLAGMLIIALGALVLVIDACANKILDAIRELKGKK